MYIRKQGKYDVLEEKEKGRVVLKISVPKARKILDAFKDLTKSQETLFFEWASKNRLYKSHPDALFEPKTI